MVLLVQWAAYQARPRGSQWKNASGRHHGSASQFVVVGGRCHETSHLEMRSTLTKPPKRPPEEQKEDDADERYYASHCSPRLVVLYEVHRIIET